MPREAREPSSAGVGHASGSPLVIGGVGGAGTRVYRAIAEIGGYHMLVVPWPVNSLRRDWHDNWLMGRCFYSRWIDPYLSGDLDDRQLERMRRTCRRLLRMSGPLHYQRGCWGWKNPRTMFLVPFFARLYPGMRYLLVLRDGRDHAFHPTFPYRAHESCLLRPEETTLEDHRRRGLFWSRANRLALHDLAEHLPGAFLVSRLEDLCSDPEGESARILAFLGTGGGDRATRAAALVRAPSSLGRWKRETPERIRDVVELIGEDLESYGYAPSLA